MGGTQAMLVAMLSSHGAMAEPMAALDVMAVHTSSRAEGSASSTELQS
jgi:hypothetical protein